MSLERISVDTTSAERGLSTGDFGSEAPHGSHEPYDYYGLPGVPIAHTARSHQAPGHPSDPDDHSDYDTILVLMSHDAEMGVEAIEAISWGVAALCKYQPNGWEVLKRATQLIHGAIEICGIRVQAPRKEPIPQMLRRIVLERDAYRCQECDSWIDLAVDHIIPESKGGLTVIENLQTLCRPCNSRKGASL